MKPLSTSLGSVVVLCLSSIALGDDTESCPGLLVRPWPIRDLVWSSPDPNLLELEAVRASFATWTQVACSDFTWDSGELDQASVVVEVLQESWVFGSAIIALTSHETDSGVPLSATVSMNDLDFEFREVSETRQCTATTMDIENVLTHELGHVIGLAHPPFEPQFEGATMFATAPPCELSKRDLASTDIEALCRLYPTGQTSCLEPQSSPLERLSAVVDIPSQDDSGGCSGLGSSHNGASLAYLALLLKLTRRKFRARGAHK